MLFERTCDKLVDYHLLWFCLKDLKSSYYTDYVKNILKKKKPSQARLDVRVKQTWTSTNCLDVFYKINPNALPTVIL